MSGRLQKAYKTQLEQWIGTGPKNFRLLYSVDKNKSFNSQTFHQQCDNQGSTVTVLYNTDNSIYGGYTSQSWTSNNSYVQDDKAFLFRLCFNGTNTFNKFPLQNVTNSIFHKSSYGPTFGGGHDLHTFSGSGGLSGAYYTLNGYFRIGTSFDNQGIQVAQINNGHMNVTDLEVYKLVDGPDQHVQWRKSLPWEQKSLKQLMAGVDTYEPPLGLRLPDTRILMIGPVGAGKSSFFNTINSIFKGRITQRGYSGSTEHSLTTVYRQYKIRSGISGENLRFRLCDTRGMEENEGLGLIEFNYLVEGNVPDWYKFDQASALCTETPGFIHIPKIKDKVHCVVFVFDSSTVDVLPKNIQEKTKDMQRRLIQRSEKLMKGVPQTVLLTKIDKISQELENDISKVFLSEEVKAVVDKVSQTMGVPRSNIFPVKNYENETELDENINILSLLALRQVLGFSDDYLENCLERMESENLSQMNIKE